MNQDKNLKKLELTNWRETIQSSLSPEKVKINFIKYPVRTEKAFAAMFKHQQYTFDVDPRLTKTQMKKLFENLFNVNIVGINTHLPPRKKVRVGTVQGYRPRFKRVIFTLKEGQSIKFD